MVLLKGSSSQHPTLRILDLGTAPWEVVEPVEVKCQYSKNDAQMRALLIGQAALLKTSVLPKAADVETPHEMLPFISLNVDPAEDIGRNGSPHYSRSDRKVLR